MSGSKVFEIKGEIIKISDTIAAYETHILRHGYSYNPLEIENKKIYINQLAILKEHRLFQMANEACQSCIYALSCMAKCDKV